MNFTPRRWLGFALGFIWLSILAAGSTISIAQLGQGLINPLSLLWIALLLLALPLTLLVLNRLYGLLTARYRVDRDGLYLRWGIAFEQIPLDLIEEASPPEAGVRKTRAEPRRPRLGFWWPGCMVGTARSETGEVIDFFATSAPLLAIRTTSGRTFVISPPDPEAFLGALWSATRMGSLETIPERSERPDYLVTRVWSDRPARSLILAGLFVPIFLLAALIVLAPTLPELVPFGFGPEGSPAPLAPPGRLLLLPMIAGLIWIADLILGAWFFRSERPVAYALWTSAIVAGILLVGATWQLLTA